MVATDGTTVWDLKPNRENTNQIFNVLCNVVPTPHPWYGEGYRRQIDVTAGEKQQYWFEKCKGLKRCPLYKYDCNTLEKINPNDPAEKAWGNANFTDVILFQNYRIYMRKSTMVLNPYGERAVPGVIDSGGDGDANSCDEGSKPSDVAKNRGLDAGLIGKETIRKESNTPGEGTFENAYMTSDRIRIYIQQVDTKTCSGDSFDEADESPIILVKEYQAAPCNPDRFIKGSGGIGTPKIICHNDELKLAMIFKDGQHFAYIYGKDFSVSSTDVIYLQDQGIYISGLYKPKGDENDIITGVGLPAGGYLIPEVSELMQLIKIPQVDPKSGILTDVEITPVKSSIKVFKEYGEIPYFAAGNQLVAIHGIFSAKDCNIPDECEIDEAIKNTKVKDRTVCEARSVKSSETRMFLYDSNVVGAKNQYVITGLSTRGARLVYIANGVLYVSGNGRMQGVFSPDLSAQGDATRGPKVIPAGLTDVKEIYGSLLLFGPKAIHAVKDENTLKAGIFLKASDTEDGYYGPGAYYNDDGEFLIVRRGKVLETMQYSAYYGTIQFTPDTGFFVNSHIKGCNPNFDKINIDATINHRYVSIFDNCHQPNKPHRSKLLIYDKHYNVWYHWMIVGARVIHVKDGIFLGDGVYVNKGRTWGREEDDTKGGEIIQIISAYVGEEGLQAPKNIQYVKTAIGTHSNITKDSKWSIATSIGGKYSERRVDITSTRHPQLLDLKEKNDTIKEYNSGEKILGHGQLLSHNLGNEFDEYLSYDKYDTPIKRELSSMEDLTVKLARFASIKESVNVPANIIQVSISSRYLDSVQFGSFYIAYYMLDADFEDIENTNMDISDYGDTTTPNDIDINRGEYCDEVLAGSACDIGYDDTILNPTP